MRFSGYGPSMMELMTWTVQIILHSARWAVVDGGDYCIGVCLRSHYVVAFFNFEKTERGNWPVIDWVTLKHILIKLSIVNFKGGGISNSLKGILLIKSLYFHEKTWLFTCTIDWWFTSLMDHTNPWNESAFINSPHLLTKSSCHNAHPHTKKMTLFGGLGSRLLQSSYP